MPVTGAFLIASLFGATALMEFGIEPFVAAAHAAHRAGLLDMRFRHRVVEVLRSGGAVTGVRGGIVEGR
jgi:predicted oxidoreductase